MGRPARERPAKTYWGAAVVVYTVLVLPISAGLAWGARRIYRGRTGVSMAAAGHAPSLQGTYIVEKIEQDVTAALRRVDEVRKANRACAVDVTDAFRTLLDRHGPTTLLAHLAREHPVMTFRDVKGPGEYIDVPRATWRRPFTFDFVRITAREVGDPGDSARLTATLLNPRC